MSKSCLLHILKGLCVVIEFLMRNLGLRMVNLAYNIISLFRQGSYEKPKHQRLQTLRLNCYAVGAWMTKKGNSMILKLAVPIKNANGWMEFLHNLTNVHSLYHL